ncbi:hypothetical protein MVEN_01737900 [Mycena venus]|uniref:Uncharacterized protein n=1 Tax=Mycena venus TaxID=2733690 RepID=A0A8H7CME0_9AGAR|nr:hypothetical protein MVEN_01737900 [Mycena venus]
MAKFELRGGLGTPIPAEVGNCRDSANSPYVAVDADEWLDEGPEGLQFKYTHTSLARPPLCPLLFLTIMQLSWVGRGVEKSARALAGAGERRHGIPPRLGQVRRRILDSRIIPMLLRRRRRDRPPTLLQYSPPLLSTHLNPADLCGFFWALTTLIFILFSSSSLAASITAYLSDPDPSQAELVD